MMSPLAAPVQAGKRIVAGLGVNVTLPAGNRLEIEYVLMRN